MENLFGICYRTVIVLVFLFFVTKMIGKKQISQLSLFDYIVGITIGSIAFFALFFNYLLLHINCISIPMIISLKSELF